MDVGNQVAVGVGMAIGGLVGEVGREAIGCGESGAFTN